MEKKWKKLAEDASRIKHIESRIRCIDEIISGQLDSVDDPGLFTGLSGLLLHKAVLWSYFREEKYYNESEKLLTRIFDIIESREINDCSYCSGLAGIGLVVHYLAKHEIFDIGWPEIINEFAPHTNLALQKCLQSDFYDFLYGATGLGIFLLETNESGEHTADIELIIENMHRFSTVDAGGRRLDQLEPYEPEFIGCNLGLAHGLPAIIIFLAKASGKGILRDKSSILAGEFTQFMINNRNTNPADILSSFPNFITEHPNHQNRHSRLAWCYGDLGVCAAMFRYADTAGDHETFKIASEVISNASERKPSTEFIPVDNPFFCHGSGGLSYMFHKAYCHTGKPELKQAASMWLDHTLAFLDDDNYLTTVSDNPDKIDFLNGLAGTSIALTSLISDAEPSWDKFFLLS